MVALYISVCHCMEDAGCDFVTSRCGFELGSGDEGRIAGGVGKELRILGPGMMGEALTVLGCVYCTVKMEASVESWCENPDARCDGFSEEREVMLKLIRFHVATNDSVIPVETPLLYAPTHTETVHQHPSKTP